MVGALYQLVRSTINDLDLIQVYGTDKDSLINLGIRFVFGDNLSEETIGVVDPRTFKVLEDYEIRENPRGSFKLFITKEESIFTQTTVRMTDETLICGYRAKPKFLVYRKIKK